MHKNIRAEIFHVHLNKLPTQSATKYFWLRSCSGIYLEVTLSFVPDSISFKMSFVLTVLNSKSLKNYVLGFISTAGSCNEVCFSLRIKWQGVLHHSTSALTCCCHAANLDVSISLVSEIKLTFVFTSSHSYSVKSPVVKH